MNVFQNSLVETFNDSKKQVIFTWFSELFKKVDTKPIAYGFLIEDLIAKHKNIKTFLFAFYNQLVDEINNNRIVDPIMLFRKILYDNGNPNKYLLNGKKITKDIIVARLMDFDHFKDLLPPEIRSKSNERLLNQLDKGLLNRFLINVKTRSPFWFVTDLFSCKKYIEDIPINHLVVYNLRNDLGLYHLRKTKQVCVLITYRVEKVDLICPTIFDAGGNVFYKPNGKEEWGCTVNLLDFSEKMREAIHPPQLIGNEIVCYNLGKPAPIGINLENYCSKMEDCLDELISSNGK